MTLRVGDESFITYHARGSSAMTKQQQTRKTAQVITANRLLDGEVVYKAKGNRWVTRVSQAQLLNDDTQCHNALQWANQQEEQCVTTGAYVIDVFCDKGIMPVSLRETIRSRGPTSEEWVGKQSAEVRQ